MRRSRRWAALTITAVGLTALAGLPAIPSANAAGQDGTRDRLRQEALRLGLQSVPKQNSNQRLKAGAAAADPSVALVRDPSQVDLAYWRNQAKARSDQRSQKLTATAKAARAKVAAAPLLVDEQEPDALLGGNDTTATAQQIPQFGTAAGKRPALRILGTLAPPPPAGSFAAAPEDNGSLPLAGETGVTSGQALRTTGTIGDGPHGSVTGDDTGDFDVYAIRGARAGSRLRVAVDHPATSRLDSIVVLYDAQGQPIAGNDDAAAGVLDSLLQTRIPADGDYYVSVTGFNIADGGILPDPDDSGSGYGPRSEGDYGVTFGLDDTDVDTYAVNLRAGDVIGGTVSGAGTRLTVFDPSGQEVFGSTQDATYIYPASSPLPGGGNAVVDHVAATAGRYFVQVQGTSGDYSVTLEGYRSGPQTRGVTQTIFLDFDGARVNTNIWGGPGVRTLSPFSAFVGRWGLSASQQNALINQVVATVTENLKQDFAGTGVKVRILNSRDNAYTFGQPNVSRLIVGGTIAESGIDTIGISQSIDPGNFETADSALILLDVVSGSVAEYEDATFNYYITPASNKVKFIGTALGNVVSHEAGHFLGNWHVDQFDTVLNLMDQGGNFPLLYGVGPDNVGGTADDPDVDFGPDALNPNEGFTGTENTRARVRWGLTTP